MFVHTPFLSGESDHVATFNQPATGSPDTGLAKRRITVRETTRRHRSGPGARLRVLRDKLGDRFLAGIVMGMADTGLQHADRLCGLPASALWQWRSRSLRHTARPSDAWRNPSDLYPGIRRWSELARIGVFTS